MRCSSDRRTCGVDLQCDARRLCSSSRGCDRGNRFHHARDESNQSKRHRFNRDVRSRHAPSRSLARCSAPRTRTSAAQPDDREFFPRRVSSGGAHGNRPPQVCSRMRVSRHLCRSGPTCPFVLRQRPDSFSSGWLRRCEVDFWASTPARGPIPQHRVVDRSCHGLCLLQG
jgi:hypothetical protein